MTHQKSMKNQIKGFIFLVDCWINQFVKKLDLYFAIKYIRVPGFMHKANFIQ